MPMASPLMSHPFRVAAQPSTASHRAKWVGASGGRRPCTVCRANTMEQLLGSGLAVSAAVANMLEEEKFWSPVWLDGIRDQIESRKLVTDVETARAAVDYLTSIGLSTHDVCNMCSISAQFLGRPVAQLKPVVEYVSGVVEGSKGLLCKALSENPKMLEYDVAEDGRCLVKPHGGRCAVEKIIAHGMGAVKVSYWREGAVFETAPVSPKKPQSL